MSTATDLIRTVDSADDSNAEDERYGQLSATLDQYLYALSVTHESPMVFKNEAVSEISERQADWVIRVGNTWIVGEVKTTHRFPSTVEQGNSRWIDINSAMNMGVPTIATNTTIPGSAANTGAPAIAANSSGPALATNAGFGTIAANFGTSMTVSNVGGPVYRQVISDLLSVMFHRPSRILNHVPDDGVEAQQEAEHLLGRVLELTAWTNDQLERWLPDRQQLPVVFSGLEWGHASGISARLRRLRDFAEVAERVSLLAGGDRAETSRVLESRSDSGRTPLDYLRSGNVAKAYLTAIDLVGPRREGLMRGRRERQGDATVALHD